MKTITISEVTSTQAVIVFTRDPDVALHDAMVDTDPFFLEWDSVDRQRHGQGWCVFAAGVDAMPEVH